MPAGRPSIYGLYSPDGELLYVGKANNPSARLKGHMREVGRRNTPLYNWIGKHGCPEMRVLISDCDDWRDDERRLIAEARGRGEARLNVADGGDEPHCPSAVRAENARKNGAKLHSDPFAKRVWYLKKNIGRALRDGYVPEEVKAKLRLCAVKRPDLFGIWADLK